MSESEGPQRRRPPVIKIPRDANGVALHRGDRVVVLQDGEWSEEEYELLSPGPKGVFARPLVWPAEGPSFLKSLRHHEVRVVESNVRVVTGEDGDTTIIVTPDGEPNVII